MIENSHFCSSGTSSLLNVGFVSLYRNTICVPQCQSMFHASISSMGPNKSSLVGGSQSQTDTNFRINETSGWPEPSLFSYPHPHRIHSNACYLLFFAPSLCKTPSCCWDSNSS